MMKYAVFSEDGLQAAFYAEDIHGSRMRPVYGESTEPGEPPPVIGEEPNPDCLIPATAVGMTDEQWQDWLQNPGLRRWNGLDVEAYEPPAPPISAAAVIEERERRLSLGFDYDFGDARGVHHISTTPSDMKGWDEVTMIANAAINAGLPNTDILILTATGPVTVTATEWQQILLASGARRQPIWQASFALQAMDPIPPDYAADHYWTAP